MADIFYNAHHSPIGAFASFTLGYKGAKGGLGLEIGKPADQSFYVGVEERPGAIHALPFFAGAETGGTAATSVDSERYVTADDAASDRVGSKTVIVPYADDTISRDFRLSSDTWTAGSLTFTLYSPVMAVPDLDDANADDAALKLAVLPAVIGEVTVDNRSGVRPKRVLVGLDGVNTQIGAGLRRLDDTSDGRLVGVAQGCDTAIATLSGEMESAQGFSMLDILNEPHPANLKFALGGAVALIGHVPAGETRTFRLAFCFYRGSIVTAGVPTTYFYTKYWSTIEDVAVSALEWFDALKGQAETADTKLFTSGLSSDQQFMVAHAVHSYYGSTEFLRDLADVPLWIVNEGEYRMMNTLDLTVDQLFFEMAMNPWTARNELDHFSSRYSYRDQVYPPGKSDALTDGGISFTHDMGVANVFSRAGHSAYEKTGLHGCFSHMTHEELVNWLCCALVYGESDAGWLSSNLAIITDCFTSMVNRDSSELAARNGIMALESSRCSGGSEITTYDSLDESLGQSRGNVYMAGKCWAAYVGLRRVFESQGLADLATQAGEQATRCAKSVCAAVAPDGTLPAVIGEDVPARIIPAIEGLIFPRAMGCPEAVDASGEFAEFIAVLSRHFGAVLRPGLCLFDDGGWKLSSSSINSWLSKIYLCQHIARTVLGIDNAQVTQLADATHVSWLLRPENTYWAWSDQMYSGEAKGSRYYPRGVTSWLWLG
ncbi:MAG TPA: glycoside hydrolase family 52 protein [Capsulimonadaceae bacterium]